MVEEDEVERLKLARTPNWNISNPDDIKSGWWHGKIRNGGKMAGTQQNERMVKYISALTRKN